MNKQEWTDFERYLITRIDNLEKEVGKIKVSFPATLWGGISGIVTALITAIAWKSK